MNLPANPVLFQYGVGPPVVPVNEWVKPVNRTEKRASLRKENHIPLHVFQRTPRNYQRLKCWWCRMSCDTGQLCTLPTDCNYKVPQHNNEDNDHRAPVTVTTWRVRGVFCNWACVQAYNRWVPAPCTDFTGMWIPLLAQQLHGVPLSSNPRRAPHWCKRKCYGGPLTDAEYRRRCMGERPPHKVSSPSSSNGDVVLLYPDGVHIMPVYEKPGAQPQSWSRPRLQLQLQSQKQQPWKFRVYRFRHGQLREQTGNKENSIAATNCWWCDRGLAKEHAAVIGVPYAYHKDRCARTHHWKVRGYFCRQSCARAHCHTNSRHHMDMLDHMLEVVCDNTASQLSRSHAPPKECLVDFGGATTYKCYARELRPLETYNVTTVSIINFSGDITHSHTNSLLCNIPSNAGRNKEFLNLPLHRKFEQYVPKPGASSEDGNSNSSAVRLACSQASIRISDIDLSKVKMVSRKDARRNRRAASNRAKTKKMCESSLSGTSQTLTTSNQSNLSKHTRPQPKKTLSTHILKAPCPPTMCHRL